MQDGRDISLGLISDHRNSQSGKLPNWICTLCLWIVSCLYYASNSFYLTNPKTLGGKVGFFCFGLVFYSLPTVFKSYSDTIQIYSDMVSFWGRSKNLNLLFFEEEKNLWNLFRAEARQWGKNLYCNPQRSRTWIELMFLQDMGFSSYE